MDTRNTRVNHPIDEPKSSERGGQMQARDVDLEVAWKLQAKKLPGRIETSIICLKICGKI